MRNKNPLIIGPRKHYQTNRLFLSK